MHDLRGFIIGIIAVIVLWAIRGLFETSKDLKANENARKNYDDECKKIQFDRELFETQRKINEFFALFIKRIRESCLSDCSHVDDLCHVLDLHIDSHGRLVSFHLGQNFRNLVVKVHYDSPSSLSSPNDSDHQRPIIQGFY